MQKQNVRLLFNNGLDTKQDPFTLATGKFTSLQNTIFTSVTGMTKRNGFQMLEPLPDRTSAFVTTFNTDLVAIGNKLQSLSTSSQEWLQKGQITPLQIDTMALLRNNTNQSQFDTAIAANGLICTVYTDNISSASASSGSITIATYKYVVSDSSTGQNVVPPTKLTSTFGTVSFATRVFTLNNHFVIVYGAFNSVYHLQYTAINTTDPSVVSSATDISTSYSPSQFGSFDGAVANNQLYLSWNGAGASGLKSAALSQALVVGNTFTISSTQASIVSVSADTTGPAPVIWSATSTATSSLGVIVATTPTAGSGSSQSLSTLFSAKPFSTAAGQIVNIALTAQNNIANVFWEKAASYNYSGVSSNIIQNFQAFSFGSVTGNTTLVRSVGLASKGFIIGSDSYFMSSYQSTYQPTYFLMNSTGAIVAKLAYQNAGGRYTTGLPSVNVNGAVAKVGYLFKDLVQSVNKNTNVVSGTQVAGIYSETGINLATYTFGAESLQAVETGKNLHINGGFLWMYDGFRPVEQGFFVYPEDDAIVSTSSQGGSLSNQTYFYVATYEWADGNGNLFRSAPSIPISVDTVGANQSVNSIAVPTLRLTYKTANPVKICIYRWSTAQQNYYQITSIQAPVLNDPTVDNITYLDQAADASILGNNLLYTTGGVLENIGAPACSALTLFDNRLWLVDSEDQNLLWYSKQILEAEPVEMSDLLTLFVPPTTSTQINTGPIKCISPMDDKLIIWKNNCIYYINGKGPDATGANSQYSDAVLITATVGCSNPNSIVFTPSGLMFQSNKGIWLLGRDLSTNYIGAPVEGFNSATVLSALTVPGTNQVRFTLNNGYTLLYDYYVNQWGSFVGIQGLSSTLYQNLHTFINQYGQVLQENQGSYLDGSNPVLMSFQTGFLNLADIQGYQRAYNLFLLGQYATPHKLTIGVAYDYDSSITQQVTIQPTNYAPPWGSDASWGSSDLWGGQTQREQWQINFQRQQCQSFQLTFNEYFDSTVASVSAGAGLSVTGINITTGLKKSYPRNIGAKNKKG